MHQASLDRGTVVVDQSCVLGRRWMFIRVVFAWGRVGPGPQRKQWGSGSLLQMEGTEQAELRCTRPLKRIVGANRLGGELGTSKY